MTMAKDKITKPVHDAGKTLQNPNSSKKDKELAAKVLSDRANEKKDKR
jgi:hypothetical protein